MSSHKVPEPPAYRMGVEAAENAASWTVEAARYDVGAIRATLAGLEEGDPAAYDALQPMPNLSGEMADDPTPLSITRDILGPRFDDLSAEEQAWHMEANAEEFERGVSDRFEAACVEVMRRYV